MVNLKEIAKNLLAGVITITIISTIPITLLGFVALVWFFPKIIIPVVFLGFSYMIGKTFRADGFFPW